MEASELYRKIRPEVERILGAVVLSESPRVVGGLSQISDKIGVTADANVQPPTTADGPNWISALAWNIERGIQLYGIIDALKNHTKLKDKDLLLLTELDYGMTRSGNRFVAEEIAEALNLNYAFAPVYIALQKGSGVESAMAGENTASIHGLSMFSRYPMTNIHTLPLPDCKGKMWGKEKGLGYLRALIPDIEYTV